MEFLSVLAATVRPVKQDDTANILSSIAAQEGPTVGGEEDLDAATGATPAQITGTQTARDAVDDTLSQTASPPGRPAHSLESTEYGTVDVDDYITRWKRQIDNAETPADVRSKRDMIKSHDMPDDVKKGLVIRAARKLARLRGAAQPARYTPQPGDEFIEEDDPDNQGTLFGSLFGYGVNGRRKRATKTYIRGAGMNPAPGAREPSHNWQQFGRYVLSRNDLENGSSVHIRYRNGQRSRTSAQRES